MKHWNVEENVRYGKTTGEAVMGGGINRIRLIRLIALSLDKYTFVTEKDTSKTNNRSSSFV